MGGGIWDVRGLGGIDYVGFVDVGVFGWIYGWFWYCFFVVRVVNFVWIFECVWWVFCVVVDWFIGFIGVDIIVVFWVWCNFGFGVIDVGIGGGVVVCWGRRGLMMSVLVWMWVMCYWVW